MIEPTIRREDRDVPIVPSASAHRAPVLKFFGEQRQGHQTEPWPVAGGGPRNFPMPTTRLPSRTRRRGSRDPRGDGPEGRWERWAEASLVCRVPVAGWTGMRDRAGHAEPRTCDGSSTPVSLEEAEHERSARGRPGLAFYTLRRLLFYLVFSLRLVPRAWARLNPTHLLSVGRK